VRFKIAALPENIDGLVNVLIDYQGSTEKHIRSIPIVLNKIKIPAVPGRGDMVNGWKVKWRSAP